MTTAFAIQSALHAVALRGTASLRSGCLLQPYSVVRKQPEEPQRQSRFMAPTREYPFSVGVFVCKQKTPEQTSSTGLFRCSSEALALLDLGHTVLEDKDNLFFVDLSVQLQLRARDLTVDRPCVGAI